MPKECHKQGCDLEMTDSHPLENSWNYMAQTSTTANVSSFSGNRAQLLSWSNSEDQGWHIRIQPPAAASQEIKEPFETGDPETTWGHPSQLLQPEGVSCFLQLISLGFC